MSLRCVHAVQTSVPVGQMDFCAFGVGRPPAPPPWWWWGRGGGTPTPPHPPLCLQVLGGDGVVVKDEGVQDAGGTVYALEDGRRDGEQEGSQEALGGFAQVSPHPQQRALPGGQGAPGELAAASS